MKKILQDHSQVKPKRNRKRYGLVHFPATTRPGSSANQCIEQSEDARARAAEMQPSGTHACPLPTRGTKHRYNRSKRVLFGPEHTRRCVHGLYMLHLGGVLHMGDSNGQSSQPLRFHGITCQGSSNDKSLTVLIDCICYMHG